MLIGPKIEGSRGSLVLEALPTTLGAAFGAGVEEALELNPARGIGRIARLARERGEIGEGFFEGHFPDPFREPPSRVLDVEEANRRFAVGDLKFSEPVPEAIALMKNEFKRKELARRDIAARSPGALGTVAFLGGALTGTIYDPFNLVAGLIPVVGPARTAALAARLGKTGGRLAKGAIEGAVGTALLEPLVLAGASAIEADFGITDALLDITFGTVLGGGLHVGVGRLADFIARQKPEVRRAALKAAVAQAAEGRTVDVESVFRAELLGTTSRAAFEPDVRPRIEGLPGRVAPEGDIPGLRIEGVQPPGRLTEGVPVETPRLAEPTPGEASIQRIVERQQNENVAEIDAAVASASKAAVERFVQLLSGFKAKDIKPIAEQILSVLKRPTEKLTKKRSTEVIVDFLNEAAERSPTFVQEVRPGTLETSGRVRGAIKTAGGISLSRLQDADFVKSVAADFEGRPSSPIAAKTETVDQIAAREGAPERDAASDFESADEAERMLERSVDDPSQIDAKAEADELEANMREDSGLSEKADLGEDAVAKADSYGKAARAAALCLSRKP